MFNVIYFGQTCIIFFNKPCRSNSLNPYHSANLAIHGMRKILQKWHSSWQSTEMNWQRSLSNLLCRAPGACDFTILSTCADCVNSVTNQKTSSFLFELLPELAAAENGYQFTRHRKQLLPQLRPHSSLVKTRIL